MLLNSNHSRSIVLALVFAGIAVQYTNAYGATNDKLDINLNIIYVGTKSQKDSNALGEMIVQFPFPLTQHARDTGQGPFGGITYFDNKTLVSDNNQLVSELGLGRIYYSATVPGDTPYTIVPFVTFYRSFNYSYRNLVGANAQVTGTSVMLPGIFSAYRFDEHFALHFDAEIHSYIEASNFRARAGFTYSPAWPWIISFSHEHISWDIDSNDASVNGSSRENNIKLIFRDPPQGNFALTLGYGNQMRKAEGQTLGQGVTFSKGTYFGVEASGGVLAW